MLNYLIAVILLFPATLWTTEENTSHKDIVPHSAYLVYDGANEFGGGLPIPSKYATFYDAQGTLLCTIEHKMNFMYSYLDPAAPKPQPVSYKIKYWNVGKGVPGDMIIFCDKHGNTIKSFRYDQATKTASIYQNGGIKKYVLDFQTYTPELNDFPLDLSMLYPKLTSEQLEILLSE